MTVDARTDPKYVVFDADERAFLTQFFVTHPAIGKKFDQFLDMPSSQRLVKAYDEIQQLPRAGWVLRGIKNPETVYDHVESLADMVGSYLTRTGASPLQRIHMMEMARNHDLPEAIASDFTPHDTSTGKVSSEDKERIELLAAKVIFAAPSNAHRLALVQEYIDQQTDESHLLHDFDKIHAVRGALFYQSTEPGIVDSEGKAPWDEFYPYAQKKMKTDAGRAYLQDIADHKEAHMEALRAMPAPQPCHLR